MPRMAFLATNTGVAPNVCPVRVVSAVGGGSASETQEGHLPHRPPP